ncbi:Na+/H+ antiporter NhaA [Porphyromonadaceae bacterium OttesenSCG-928-L07]|nr:Na+/H+ antiporter NhaA [Porphyromonadaceae bacterium OttesenSCG-928-L07]MDL2252262.1 Na+/H+ antiporter NhaA [Odoribacter sp. OttesenSCG-928-J03]
MNITVNKDFFKYSIRHFIKGKMNSGVILVFTAIIALIFANSGLQEIYNSILSKEVVFKIGDFSLFHAHGTNMNLLALINDALMSIFFFSVGLEIKREVLVGELSSVRKAFLPIVAACGGMIVPVLFFLLIAPPGEALKGAAIPMATDIAFSLGVLAILGKRVPLCLKIFLTAFAIVDDIGGIIVIAAFYTTHLVPEYLFWSLPLIAILYIGGYFGVSSKMFYILIGSIVWYLFLNSGVHATIAGVIVAFSVPARPRICLGTYVKDISNSLQRLPIHNADANRILEDSELSVLKHIESTSDKAISPLQSMEDNIRPLVNYIVMPVFAFANAGVSFSGFSLAAFQGLSSTIFLSLVFGKLIGIFSFTWLAVKTGLMKLPERMNFKSLFGVSMLGGIGFTVSLFIASLSYSDSAAGHILLDQAKIGILLGSTFAGLFGYFILKWALRTPKER